MKKIKKLLAFALAMVMCLGMAVTASAAAGEYTLKLNTKNGHTYKVYQLLTGVVSEDGATLSNIQKGSSAKAELNVGDIENELKVANNNPEVYKDGIALSKTVAGMINVDAPVKTIVGDGTQKVETLAGGYYVIMDEYTEGSTEATDPKTTLSATMVQIVADVTITPKSADVPEKPGKTVNSSNGSIGDTFTYTLSGTIPQMNNYEAYTYVLVDTLPAALTPGVQVNDTFTSTLTGGPTNPDKTQVVFKVTSITPNYDEVDTTKIVSNTIRFEMVDAYEYRNMAGASYSFNYTAKLNKDAEANTGITNTVAVEYPNDPDDISIKGTTASTEATVYTTSLTINKVDGSNNDAALDGAEFELTGVDAKKVGYVTGQEYVPMAQAPEGYTGKTWYKLVGGAYTDTPPAVDGSTNNKYVSTTETYALVEVNKVDYTDEQTTAKAFVDSAGNVTFTGLGAGTYILKEITAPDGYNKIDDITIEITFDETSKTFTAKVAGENGANVSLDAWKIQNFAGSMLPSTGGIGTTIFYVVGGLLVVGAGILLITKKRISKEQ
jgi:fimbrial isopeptide formation D2 family protein/LPXTG-motif cell wall-anchored protein